VIRSNFRFASCLIFAVSIIGCSSEMDSPDLDEGMDGAARNEVDNTLGGMKFPGFITAPMVMSENLNRELLLRWCGQDGDGQGTGYVPEFCSCLESKLKETVNSEARFAWQGYLHVTYAPDRGSDRQTALKDSMLTEEHYAALRSLVNEQWRPNMRACAEELASAE